MTPANTIKPLSDPTIDEIREIRNAISAQFNHDPEQLVAHLMKLQEQPEYRERLIQHAGIPLTQMPAA